VVVRALICGITGQDGAYLSQFLLSKGYEVWGTSRDIHIAKLTNLNLLQVISKLKLLSMAPNDFRSVLTALQVSKPDEVYFLAGQSSVGLSFEQPVETLESITLGTLNMLEAIRFGGRPIRLYHASSSECFGNVGKQPADESTPFQPSSPYAVAKASSHWLVANYRQAYGIYACNGILFNHESPLRPDRFVTRKIVASAARIAKGSKEKLTLGRLDIVRDWGWAPDYVEAMWLMLQQKHPEDFVIATGLAYSLQNFVQEAFNFFNLDWTEHTLSSEEFFRPSDLQWSQGKPDKARNYLGWQSRCFMPNVVQMLCEAESKNLK
jgi:GDPmannose 4,6-dehydratase